VHLYHVDLVLEWVAERANQARQSHNSWNIQGQGAAEQTSSSNQSLPASSTYTSLSLPRSSTGGSATALLFLDPSTLLVCLGKLGVYCWKLLERARTSLSLSSSPPISQLQWEYQPHGNAIIQSMTSLGPDGVVLGTDQGTVLWVNWTQMTNIRQRAAFSTGIELPKPRVVHEWIPTFGSDMEGEDGSLPRRKLAISKIHVEAFGCKKVESGSDDHAIPDLSNASKQGTDGSRKREYWYGRCRILWLTQCGWGLSMTVDLPSPRSSSRRRTNETCCVWHAPPKLILQNAEGMVIDTRTNQCSKDGNNNLHDNLWSLPLQPVASDCSSSSGSHSSACNTNNGNATITCWTSVPAVTKILPHHNKYVLDSQPRILRESKSVLFWKDWRRSSTSSDDGSQGEEDVQAIPIPKSWTTPTMIAVHPSREWIVVGGMKQHHLGVLSARG
jgi:hypothetical protein